MLEKRRDDVSIHSIHILAARDADPLNQRPNFQLGPLRIYPTCYQFDPERAYIAAVV
jgi:hypothetical protein